MLGISGFGGAGKSTLARRISELTGAPVVGVDSFFRHTNFEDCPNWSCIDFDRLKSEIVEPFEAGVSTISYREFDWEQNRPGGVRTISHEGLLILEGVRLIGSPIQPSISFSIWIDCPIDIAIARGKYRDKTTYGVDNDELWDGIWKDNDLEYARLFEPMRRADAVIGCEDFGDSPSQN